MARDDEAEIVTDDEDEGEGEVVTRSRFGGFAAGLAVGALVGAAVALLFAPDEGSVTRRRLKRKIDRVKDVAGEELESLGRRAKREIRKRIDSV